MSKSRVYEPLLVTPENQSAYEDMQAYIADYSDKPDVAKRAAVLTSGLAIEDLQSSGFVTVEESTEIAYGRLVVITKQNLFEYDKKINGNDGNNNRSRNMNGLLRVFMHEAAAINESPFIIYGRFNNEGIADAVGVDTLPLLFDILKKIRQAYTVPTELITSEKGRIEASKLPNNVHHLLGEFGIHLFKQLENQ